MRSTTLVHGILPGMLAVAGIGLVAVLSTGSIAQNSINEQAESARRTLSANPGAAEATTFAIDGVHSMALFRVVHMGAGPFWGRFNDVGGTFTMGSSSADLSFDVTIGVGSVDSGNEKLDGHLKSPDFFAVAEFPTATFKSTRVSPAGSGKYEVTGDLTIRGITKPVTAMVEHVGTADLGRGRRCGFEATFEIDRGAFDVEYGLDSGSLGRTTRMIIGLEGIESAEPARPAEGGGLPGRMAALDANGDGKIQKSEAPERLQAIFDQLDADDDGALDASELEAMRRGGNRGRGGGNG